MVRFITLRRVAVAAVVASGVLLGACSSEPPPPPPAPATTAPAPAPAPVVRG